ncbi:MAG: phage tail assembly protein [Xenococcaceae cyanobacterium MO_207.B15]|nr:phage tail assembly protein [Xenococcaceae cyanobacterium MO_207.B15]MDJ0745966.1 phage tail assembly protein [Xenococcaceae cyanobacterium MO_167.B27]
MLQTEFEFTLPKGYLDEEGNIHRKGIMRLSRARDEIAPLKDPRVKSNPAYATIIILARVIVKLGALEIINPSIVEDFFAEDLNYLQHFYRHINGLSTTEDSHRNNGKEAIVVNH